MNKELLENAVINYVDDMIEIGNVNLKDKEEETQNFSIVHLPENINRLYNIDIETFLISSRNKKHKLVGYVEEWHDTENKLPCYLKNKDNIVTKPDSYEPIDEYKLFDNTFLQEGTYCEYKFLEDHGNLQKTYNVNITYN